MNEQKTYINGLTVKEKKFANGNAILKIGVNVDKLMAQLSQHRNAKGYVNLAISARKTVGQYGDTHCVWLDTWEPTRRDVPAVTPPPQPAASATDTERANLAFDLAGEGGAEEMPF